MIMTLPQDMDALVLNGIRDFSIKTIPVPVPDVDDVICKVGHYVHMRYRSSYYRRRFSRFLANSV
jgi:hypothetical protein